MQTEQKDSPADSQATGAVRRPVIAFVGHVDCGKTALVNALCVATGSVPAPYVAAGKIAKSDTIKSLSNEELDDMFALDVALLNDFTSSKVELERDITVQYRHLPLTLPGLSAVLLDTSGHRDFMKNVMSSLWLSDVLVLVVAALDGEFETGYRKIAQTARLMSVLGVRRVVVAVTKMDSYLKKHDPCTRFEAVRDETVALLCKAGKLLAEQITCVPVSAWKNLNVTTRHYAWFKGPTLVEALQAAASTKPALDKTDSKSSSQGDSKSSSQGDSKSSASAVAADDAKSRPAALVLTRWRLVQPDPADRRADWLNRVEHIVTHRQGTRCTWDRPKPTPKLETKRHELVFVGHVCAGELRVGATLRALPASVAAAAAAAAAASDSADEKGIASASRSDSKSTGHNASSSIRGHQEPRCPTAFVVQSIEVFGQPTERAVAGQHVGVVLRDAATERSESKVAGGSADSETESKAHSVRAKQHGLWRRCMRPGFVLVGDAIIEPSSVPTFQTLELEALIVPMPAVTWQCTIGVGSVCMLSAAGGCFVPCCVVSLETQGTERKATAASVCFRSRPVRRKQLQVKGKVVAGAPSAESKAPSVRTDSALVRLVVQRPVALEVASSRSGRFMLFDKHEVIAAGRVTSTVSHADILRCLERELVSVLPAPIMRCIADYHCAPLTLRQGWPPVLWR